MRDNLVLRVELTNRETISDLLDVAEAMTEEGMQVERVTAVRIDGKVQGTVEGRWRE